VSGALLVDLRFEMHSLHMFDLREGRRLFRMTRTSFGSSVPCVNDYDSRFHQSSQHPLQKSQELSNLMKVLTPLLARMGSRVSSEPAITSGSPATR
jgi:hypothetical protein